MNILIPISSYSEFFPENEFYFPKPLIEVVGQPMISLVVNRLQDIFPNSTFIFVVNANDSRSFSLDSTLKLLAGPSTVVIEKSDRTSGALCSCLLAIDSVDHSLPLIISNCDQLIEYDLSHSIEYFEDQLASAGVVTFDSVHPRWSYIIKDYKTNRVLQSVEKRVVSRHAIAGLYYFKEAKLFFDAAKQSILQHSHTNGQFYISSTLNHIILSGAKVLDDKIPERSYHSFYGPSKLVEFERTSFANKLRDKSPIQKLVNVVIPAAGEGSRFSKAGWKKPKPFIDVNGQPMIQQVINNTSLTYSQHTILLRKEHFTDYPFIIKDIMHPPVNTFSVDHPTEGTASTVLLARNKFNDSNPLLIANCDQLVDFDINEYVKDCFTRNLDGSILVFRDVSMDPKWSFVKLDENQLVSEVAEKKPISDLATVGIYLFSKGSHFVSAAIDMILANDRINNEFYTCPVYNYMIKMGLRIGVFEIPQSAMSGLGTPSDLITYLDSSDLLPSIDMP